MTPLSNPRPAPPSFVYVSTHLPNNAFLRRFVRSKVIKNQKSAVFAFFESLDHFEFFNLFLKYFPHFFIIALCPIKFGCVFYPAKIGFPMGMHFLEVFLGAFFLGGGGRALLVCNCPQNTSPSSSNQGGGGVATTTKSINSHRVSYVHPCNRSTSLGFNSLQSFYFPPAICIFVEYLPLKWSDKFRQGFTVTCNSIIFLPSIPNIPQVSFSPRKKPTNTLTLSPKQKYHIATKACLSRNFGSDSKLFSAVQLSARPLLRIFLLNGASDTAPGPRNATPGASNRTTGLLCQLQMFAEHELITCFFCLYPYTCRYAYVYFFDHHFFEIFLCTCALICVWICVCIFFEEVRFCTFFMFAVCATNLRNRAPALLCIPPGNCLGG